MSATGTNVRHKPAPVPVRGMTAAQVRVRHAEREAEYALKDYLEMQPEPARPERPPAGRYVQVRTGRWIPYNTALRVALRDALRRRVSVNTTILFAHLEWRFSQTHGRPFWKRHGPSRVREEADAPGGGWATETGLSRFEFNTAFLQIGVIYGTKGEFDSVGDPFIDENGVERPYASYFNRLSKRNYYVRNGDWFENNLHEDWFKKRKS